MAAFPTPINPLASTLERRKLSAEEGVMLGLKHLDTRSLQDMFGTNIPLGVTSHSLPYYDIDGSELLARDGDPFVRYRLEGPIPPDMGKYRQRRGSGLAVYIPRIGGMNWVEIAHDPTEVMWITEGEFKSIEVCRKGIPCVGLGGVDNWREKDGTWARPLNHFQWVGRKVFVCYDADKESTQEAPYKPQVEGAARRIAARLFESGAEVFYLYLARTEVFRKARAKNTDAKMGIDDYLQAGGTIDDLLGTADLASQDAIMARLLREYAVYMGGKPHVVRLSDGVQFRRSEFTDVVEASAIRMVPRPKGGVLEMRVADEWLKSRERNEVYSYVFKPGEDHGYNSELKEYNIWGGFAVAGAASEHYNEVVKVWRKFVAGLFGEQAEFFEKWVAHMFQRPGEKTSIAVILASVLTGVGKSLLGEVVRGLIGRDGSVALELDRLKSNFNTVIQRKLFVQMDEAEGTFLGLEAKLDDLVTADTVIIEPKGFDAYVVDNLARLFLTSNSTRPIRLKAENRRFLVVSPELTMADAKGAWGQWVRDTVAVVLKSEDGLRCLRWYLDRVDLTGWVPTARVPITAAMLEMVESGKTKAGDVVSGLWESFEECGDIWALTGELTRQDGKVWSDFKALVKSNGGQTLAHAVKVKGKAIKCTIVDRAGKLPRKMMEDKWWLDNAGSDGKPQVITGEQIQEAMARTLRAYTEWTSTVRSDKF